jgi:hypothetical protein
MSEMVRRVATVIAENDDACSGARVPCVTAPPGSPDECQCMRTARAAMVEIREPTEAMLRAAADAVDPYGAIPEFRRGDAEAHWHVMIDTALAD